MAEPADIIRLLKRIHQTRDFIDQPVPDDVVTDLLDVARWTGSARNVQPWHFVVIEDRQELIELSELGPSASFFNNAQLVIAVIIDQSSPTPSFDEARVVERLFIAAAAHGLAAGIGTFNPSNIPRANQRLELPEGLNFHAGVAIGYPAQRPESTGAKSPARKPLDSILHYGTFGNKQK